MKEYLLLLCALIFGYCIIGSAGTEEKPEAAISPVKTVNVTNEESAGKTDNCTGSGNVTCNSNIHQGILGMVSDAFMENKGMLQRTFYVLIGVTSIIVLYFVVRTVRLRRRQSKSKKYGVISTRGQDNLEMIPLDQDEDDEDMTVFEVNGHPR